VGGGRRMGKMDERPTQRHIVTGDVSEDRTWHSSSSTAGAHRICALRRFLAAEGWAARAMPDPDAFVELLSTTRSSFPRHFPRASPPPAHSSAFSSCSQWQPPRCSRGPTCCAWGSPPCAGFLRSCRGRRLEVLSSPSSEPLR